MARSKVSICNSALIKLGENVITSLDEDTKPAILCNHQYDILLEDLLRMHEWNFAISRQQLAKLSTSPAFEFDNQYELPTDFLKVVGFYDGATASYKADGEVNYVIESGKILTNESPLKLRYIRKVEDPNDFTSDFAELLAWRLAAELSWSLIQSRTYRADIFNQMSNKLADVRGNDARDSQPQQLVTETWTDSRHRGPS